MSRLLVNLVTVLALIAVFAIPGELPADEAEAALAKYNQRIDQAVLMETSLSDLRSRNAGLRREVLRHAALTVSQRLAALILDVHDLDGGDALPLRQSDLAALMSVRRASVSTACTELHAAGAIRLRRAAIHIADVDALRVAAGTPHSTVTDLARLRG